MNIFYIKLNGVQTKNIDIEDVRKLISGSGKLINGKIYSSNWKYDGECKFRRG